LAREKFAFKGKISSDCASVWPLVKNLLDANIDIHFMRDPTRAGVSAALNEIIEGNRFSIFLDEKTLPVDNNCNIFAEILGLDVLDVANEGKALLFVAPKDAGKALKIMRKSSLGKKAAIIGEVKTDNRLLAGKVYLKTKIKGLRLVDMPQDEPTPRIC
jgi:hydrogenase expression/formation protein HypE